MERGYYLLTIKRPQEDFETIWYHGSLTSFLVIEKNSGKQNTAIMWHKEISKDEYEYAVSISR